MKHSRFLAHLILAALLYQVCQNCVELDPGTLAGILIADIIATLLLSLGVYCFAGHETTGRLSGAADTQALLRNEQLYQPLRDHDDGQYSRLGGNWARNK
uniref:CD3 delta subunit of T-cell receptor complex n=1 Tax=Sciurus vulgaris TaxID=55149 RepID=A0A8D2DXL6_SCIVU